MRRLPRPGGPSDLRPILKLNGVSKSFGRAANPIQVLEDVHVSIRPGEKASLVGPSGSGKSTLLSLLATHRVDYGRSATGQRPRAD